MGARGIAIRGPLTSATRRLVGNLKWLKTYPGVGHRRPVVNCPRDLELCYVLFGAFHFTRQDRLNKPKHAVLVDVGASCYNVIGDSPDG